MFAVSRKPISNTNTTNSTVTQTQHKFAVKSEIKPKEKEITAAIGTAQTQLPGQKTNQETTSRKLFENVKDAANSGNTSNVAQPNHNPRKIKVRLSIIKDVPYSQKFSVSTQNESEKKFKKTKEMKLKNRKTRREGNFNCGRWQQDEHQRFIEAIMKYGNEWKSVQKHVGTRSSTQARSHAQKFFVKMKKANLLDLNIDFSKNSIKTLHEIANSLNSEEYVNAIKALNCVAFERKNTQKRKKREDSHSFNTLNNDSSVLFTEAPSALNLNHDDLFSLNTNDNTIFLGANKPSIIIEASNNKHKDQKTSKKNSKKNNGNTIIINNNYNTFNYNVNFSNFNQETRNENTYLLRKRNRLNSFEGVFNFNLFPDLGKENGGFSNINCTFKRFDEKEYVDNFNCTFKDSTPQNDFDMDKELEEMIMLSNGDELNNSISRRKSSDKEGNIFEDIMLDFYIETTKN